MIPMHLMIQRLRLKLFGRIIRMEGDGDVEHLFSVKVIASNEI